MENQEQKNEAVVFGLTPLATIVNSIVMLALSGILWAIYFYKHLPPGLNVLDPVQMKGVKLDTEVPWYIDWPIQLIGMYMLFRWLDYKFKFKNEELMSFRVLMYKLVFGLMPIMLFVGTVKFTTLITIIKLNQ